MLVATYTSSLNSFLSAATQPCDGSGLGLDITLGRAGILLACRSLLGILPAQGKAEDDTHDRLRALGRQILSEIWDKLDSFAPIPNSKEAA